MSEWAFMVINTYYLHFL